MTTIRENFVKQYIGNIKILAHQAKGFTSHDLLCPTCYGTGISGDLPDIADKCSTCLGEGNLPIPWCEVENA
jgi:DnaJ-class molecular chaperone